MAQRKEKAKQDRPGGAALDPARDLAGRVGPQASRVAGQAKGVSFSLLFDSELDRLRLWAVGPNDPEFWAER